MERVPSVTYRPLALPLTSANDDSNALCSLGIRIAALAVQPVQAVRLNRVREKIDKAERAFRDGSRKP